MTWKPTEEVTYEVQYAFPANGWRAVYAVREDDWAPGEYIRQDITLICFALITNEQGGDCQLVGMIPDGMDISPCVTDHFIGYLSEKDSLDLPEIIAAFCDWKEARAAKEQLKIN